MKLSLIWEITYVGEMERKDDNATLVAMAPLICKERNPLVQGRQEDTFGVTGFNCLIQFCCVFVR